MSAAQTSQMNRADAFFFFKLGSVITGAIILLIKVQPFAKVYTHFILKKFTVFIIHNY